MGHPFVDSDVAIQCLLSLRELFRLPYRQTEGLARSLVQLMEVETPIPDYTSLAKRAATTPVSLDSTKHTGPIDVVVDSTGLKVYGEGEWKVRIHGAGEAPHVAEAAFGCQSPHAGDRGGDVDGEQRPRRRPG